MQLGRVGFAAAARLTAARRSQGDAPAQHETETDEMRAEAMPKSGKEDVPVVTRA